MAEKRILEKQSFLIRKFMVQPIIGERNGNSDLSAIQKGLDHRPGSPARLGTQLRQGSARGVQGICFSLAIADQRQESRMYQAAALTFDPSPEFLFGRG